MCSFEGNGSSTLRSPGDRDNDLSIARKLEEIRVFFGFRSDSEFARALGIDSQHYSKIKHGQHPNFALIRTGMDRIGVRLDFLSVPGAHPADYLVDRDDEHAKRTIGALRRELAQREERIAELEEALRALNRTWNEVRTIFPSKPQ